MIDVIRLVLFRMEGQRYALGLDAVVRIVQAAEITPLPEAPEIVLGVIEADEGVLAVLNARRRFKLPERDIRPSDHFLIARTARRTVALVIDEAEGVVERSPGEIVQAPKIVPGLEHVRGIARLADGLVLIHDLETFLSLDEERILDAAMSREGNHGV